MALINCNECGKRISDKAKKCPNCGAPIKRIKDSSNIRLIIIIIIIGLFVYFIFNNFYYGRYEASDGSVMILKPNGKCSLTIYITTIRNGSNLLICPSYNKNCNGPTIQSELSTSNSCFYENKGNYIIMTFSHSNSTSGTITNRYDYSSKNNSFTWNGHDKVYYKK